MKTGDTVRHIKTGEVGIIRSMNAQEKDGSPACYVEVHKPDGRKPHINRVWSCEEVEVVE